MSESIAVLTFAGGEVSMWVDGGIHLRAISPHGDPTELTSDMAREIAHSLISLAEQLDDD